MSQKIPMELRDTYDKKERLICYKCVHMMKVYKATQRRPEFKHKCAINAICGLDTVNMKCKNFKKETSEEFLKRF